MPKPPRARRTTGCARCRAATRRRARRRASAPGARSRPRWRAPTLSPRIGNYVFGRLCSRWGALPRGDDWRVASYGLVAGSDAEARERVFAPDSAYRYTFGWISTRSSSALAVSRILSRGRYTVRRT